MAHKFIHDGKGQSKYDRLKEIRRHATMAAKGTPIGRPKHDPSTVKFLVFSMFRAIEKSKKSLDDVNYAAVHKAVKAKFPDGKFDLRHFTWYLSLYRHTKLEANFDEIVKRQQEKKSQFPEYHQ